VQNLGNNKDDPSDDANIVQICRPETSPGPHTIELRTAANSNSPYCTTIFLELAPDPPVFPTPGCPSSTYPIPQNKLFRVKSQRLGTWLLGPEADQAPAATLTPDRDAATLFSVSDVGTDRIVYGGSATQLFEAYFENNYPPNSGSINFGPLDLVTPPVLFCLQPDNTFTLFSVGDDGPQTSQDPNSDPDFNVDPTVAVTCPQEQGSVYNVFIDNGIYMARNPSGPFYPDTLVYEPVPAYQPPVGCPSTTIPIPDMEFRIRSTTQQTATENVWLLGPPDGTSGQITTTSNGDLATRFSPATDGTGRIQVMSGGVTLYSLFTPFFARNSGFISMFRQSPLQDSQEPQIAVQFCLQSDYTFFVRSDGVDGPGADDASFVLTCPSRDRQVFVDNGSYQPGFDSTCSRDTLYYEKI
jgi:hypothetical protein